MQLDVLQLFCSIARERSISGAAILHDVTQSAASQRIKSLERELGVRLINRGTRPLQLTASGEIYRRGCQEILERYEQIKKQLAEPSEMISGTVQVAAIYSAGIGLLTDIINRFEAQHAKVQVQVDYQQPSTVHKQVRDHGVDFGILSYPKKWGDLTTQLLREETMVVVCAADHPLSERQVLTPPELVDHALVGFESSLPIASELGAYLRRNGGDPELNHTFDNIDTIKIFVGHSDEVAILPYHTVRQEVEEGILTAVRLEPAVSRPLAIVGPPNRLQSPAASALIETLLADTTSSLESEPSAPNGYLGEQDSACSKRLA